MTASTRTLALTRASETPLRRPPWPHYPHCPACHRRLASANPEATRRARGYPLLPCDGHTCPHCDADLGTEDRA